MLPKYFIIKQCEDPLWKQYIAWLNETCGQDWLGNCYEYYGIDGSLSYNGSNCKDEPYYFQNNPVLITLEEWAAGNITLPEIY